MTSNAAIGSVCGIWRFPVKSMQGEKLEQAEFTEGGLVGDRGFAIIDTETGNVVSAKSVRHFPDIFGYRAAYVAPPEMGNTLPAIVITLPDGQTVRSDSADVDDVLSKSFGRAVTLASAAPKDFTIDMYHPDVAGANPEGQRDIFVEQKLGSALFAQLGMPSPVPDSAFFDVFPVSVLTTSTLRRLSELQPGSAFDERRFRMNVIVEAVEDGFVENDWIEKDVSFGDAVQIHVTMPDARCAMTTLAQGDLPKDNDVMRAMVQHNRLPLGDKGRYPCAGVYAVVQKPGLLRIGDAVSIVAPELRCVVHY